MKNPLAVGLGVAKGASNALLNQMAIPGNIDINARPVVRNPDGSISTVRSMSINVDGLEFLIPTVNEDGRIMNDQEAVQHFFTTKRHLGAFRTINQADTYANRLHEQQSRRYK